MLAIGLGEKDVGGALEVFDGFSEDATGEEVAVAEGVGFIDEEEIKSAFEVEVLEAVVEDKGIDSEFLDSVEAGFNAVFIDEDGDAWEVAGEHEGFIAGEFRIEKDLIAI